MAHIRLGTDLVHIPKLTRLLEDTPTLDRLFHADERAPEDPAHLAGILAAKEAFFKALGRAPEWLAVEVRHETGGRPFLTFAPHLKMHARTECQLSISHDGEYALAAVVLVDGA